MSTEDDYYESITIQFGRHSGRLRPPSDGPAGADWADASLTFRFDLSDVDKVAAARRMAAPRPARGS